jgi:nucleoside-diphosphate-sugar epimerase
MKRIFVTGGGGFLGRHIVRRLRKRGHSVVAFQRSPAPELSAMGVEVAQGSLLQKDALIAAMNGCDAVIHTAALAGVWGPRKDYFSTNVEGTAHVRAAMEHHGIQKLVHCSTPSVVFSGEPFRGADESLPYGRNWLCAYAESKAEAERATLDWARSGKASVIALRPHLIYGEGDPHLVPTILERSRAGRLRIVGEGKNRVDLTSVETAAEAHVRALELLDDAAWRNRPYFLSDGQPVVLWDWIQDLLQREGIPPLKRQVSLRTAYRLGAICEFIWGTLRLSSIPPMTRFVAVELGKDHWFSVKAAREAGLLDA